MPSLLERKPKTDDAFCSLRPVDEMTGHWWLALVQGGMEKRLARRLTVERSDYFLPLSRVKTDHREIKYKPLFPSYIFLNGDDSCDIAHDSPECLTIYPVSKKTQPILQAELSSIFLAIEVNPALGMERYHFTAGQKVRVFKGPMMGIEGEIDRESDDFRMWLKVTMMGQKGIPLEVPTEFLEYI